MSEEITDRDFVFISVFSVALFLASLLCAGFAFVLITLSEVASGIYLACVGLLALSLFAAMLTNGINHQIWERIGVWTHPALSEVSTDE